MTSIAATWGSTPAERAAPFPCDAYLANSTQLLFRAVTIQAPPRVVFLWLCQLKIAPYSYDWIDNWGRTSPRTLTPGADVLAVGQRFMSIFELVDFAEDRHVTMVLLHGSKIFGKIALSYVVHPEPSGATRLLVKLRVEHGHSAFARLRAAVLAFGDFVMMRKQLLTLKRLAERPAPRAPSSSGP